MPTPDASQFTQKKKFAAIITRQQTGGPKLVNNHLHQYVPRTSGLVDFLPSFTNKIYTPRFINQNVLAGPQHKPTNPR